MSIRIEDLPGMDFSDLVEAGEGMPPVHPGEILREEFLVPLGMSAHALRIPATRVNDIVRGKRGITADTALRLARYFGSSAEFWLGLQASYDAKTAMVEIGEQVNREITPLRQAA
jgi:addiction module HigA family antidote